MRTPRLPLAHRTILAAAIALAGLAAAAHAAVVTSNNLATTSLGSLTENGTTQVYVPFIVSPGVLNGVSATVQSTTTGGEIASYAIDGISTVATPTNAQLIASNTLYLKPVAYGPTAHQLKFVPGAAVTSANYHLGVGRTSDFGNYNWNWQSDSITAYAPAGDDAGLLGAGFKGNLVPNASFENTSIMFWRGATFLANPGVHGSTVASVGGTSTANTLAIPVTPGKTYFYSFWQVRSGDWSFAEWGLTDPNDGSFWDAEGSNSLAAGAAAWTEFTGSFTPALGQDFFYLNGRSNTSPIYFDSVVVQLIPEPTTLALAGFAMSAILLRRRR